MLSPRHFGKPTDRHRPKISFEEFLRQHEMRQRIKNRRSVHILAPVSSTDNVLAEEQHSRSSASLEHYLDKRNRYKSLPTRNNGNSAQQQAMQTHLDSDKENMELQTPTLDSIVTPVTMRRTARQYTPSRVRDHSNVARSLFASPRTPLASPVRRMFRKDLAPRFAEPRRLSPEEQAKISSGSSRNAGSGLNRRAFSMRLPARTTPPTSGETLPSAGNPASRGNGKSRAFIDRPADGSGGGRIALPLRRVRPTTSASSTSTITPPLAQQYSTIASDAKPNSDSPESQHPEGRQEEPIERRESLVAKARQLKKSAYFTRPSASSSSTQGDAKADHIQYPDLLHKLEEHNRRMRMSGKHNKAKLEELPNPQRDITPPLHNPERRGQGKPADEVESSQDSVEGEAKDMPPDTVPKNEARNSGPLSLSDLLQSENHRILNERKQRLPERKKAIKANKMTVLQRIEGQRQAAALQGKRNSALVEFTSSVPVQRPRQGGYQKQPTRPSGSVRFKSSKPKNSNVPPRNNPSQNRAQGVKKRTKSTGTASLKGDGHQEPKPSRGANVTRAITNKTSRTDQIKAAAKQKLEEDRLESDLQSMLNQHNSRVKNNRKVRT
ncbi:unnamed protein product [Chondrus crispus]|uniref:Uncharacterized protein n=1 Tax=Chondrus crispus TaxID=2769 RepID=R7Q870_CHOCR|nr:unnamed protein product [Chondrus crispus]CDF34747.1 unnamed protein product [Chondrus crispus]|eukprot:XP_005714566.1 unnamed protein product [Chondrus crispus]